MSTIEKCDQDFVWYNNFTEFSIVLIKKIVIYCDKTGQKKKRKKIIENKAILKTVAEKKRITNK